MRTERPILFSKQMVIALLAGLKTQTRRTVGLNSFNANPDAYKDPICYAEDKNSTGMAVVHFLPTNEFDNTWYIAHCPYGQVGDRLWVREAWMYRADDGPDTLSYYFAAGDSFGNFLHPDHYWVVKNQIGKLKPSIHMRKSFARIWLEIVDIRIERLLSISERDALAEGVERWPSKVTNLGKRFNTLYQCYKTPVEYGSQSPEAYFAASQSFIELWETINEPLTNKNPWVWVLEFKVLSLAGKEFIPADQEAVAI